MITVTTAGQQIRNEESRDEFCREVIDWFQGDSPTLSARWLYDHRGSQLFERITRTPEYYPTRMEIELLERNALEMREAIGGQGRMLVEFGSGSSRKTHLLLRSLQPYRYVPIDVSQEFLEHAVGGLQTEFPDLDIQPIVGDFSQQIDLPSCERRLPVVGFFPGSTIGNFTPKTAVDLLRSMAETLGEDACLLIGMDSCKPLDILLPAYDDATKVTAAFNLNLLERINRELDADIPIPAFRHEARWNEEKSRVEMHLVATASVRFGICNQEIAVAAGQSLHTENSHKYGERDAAMLLRAGGWEPVEMWSDPKHMFRIYLATVAQRD